MHTASLPAPEDPPKQKAPPGLAKADSGDESTATSHDHAPDPSGLYVVHLGGGDLAEMFHADASERLLIDAFIDELEPGTGACAAPANELLDYIVCRAGIDGTTDREVHLHCGTMRIVDGGPQHWQGALRLHELLDGLVDMRFRATAASTAVR